MKTLQELLSERGLDLRSAHKLGVPYHSLQKQLKGLRGIGPKSAMLYEELLGIPKSETRPDLWPPQDN